jgi:pimeloyl-ACP methyl ester carboxylesterase
MICFQIRRSYAHVAWLALLLISSFLSASASTLVIPTDDKSSHLNIEVDMPKSNKNKSHPVIVMMGGTFSDRDGLTSATEMDSSRINDYMLHRVLSSRLTRAGFIVVRYDPRGVNGSRASCRLGQLLPADIYYQECIDSKIRTTVTPKNFRADFKQVFDFATTINGADKQQIFVLGHSEGSLHLSVLVEEKKIAPAGAIFLTGVAGSPAALNQWQIVDRVVALFPSIDKDMDGFVTNQEIDVAAADKTTLFSKLTYGKPNAYYAPGGSWMLKHLKSARQYLNQTLYQGILNGYETYANPESTPLISIENGQQYVMASQLWMKSRATDNTPVISRLATYSKPVLYIFMSEDSQISNEIQLKQIQDASKKQRTEIKAVTIKGYGHTLGLLPFGGKVEPKAVAQVVDSIMAWLPRKH